MQDLEHIFIKCHGVVDAAKSISNVLEQFLDQNIQHLVYFSFNHRNKKKLGWAVWFAVKVMYNIYQNNCRNKSQILANIIKEVDWNLKRQKYLGSLGEMLKLKSIVNRELGTIV